MAGLVAPPTRRHSPPICMACLGTRRRTHLSEQSDFDEACVHKTCTQRCDLEDVRRHSTQHLTMLETQDAKE